MHTLCPLSADLLVIGQWEDVVVAEEAVGAEAVEWAEAMVLILEANGNLIDTVAAIGRKCFSSLM